MFFLLQILPVLKDDTDKENQQANIKVMVVTI